MSRLARLEDDTIMEPRSKPAQQSVENASRFSAPY
jgi:hypothetical protein